MAVPARAYLSIGEVLNRLRGDFADITISKIRFLSVTEHLLVSGDEFQIGKFHLLFVGSN